MVVMRSDTSGREEASSCSAATATAKYSMGRPISPLPHALVDRDAFDPIIERIVTLATPRSDRASPKSQGALSTTSLYGGPRHSRKALIEPPQLGGAEEHQEPRAVWWS